MTSETIHTCSYACERPECIRAQRDELASRLTAPQPAAEGVQAGEVERIRAAQDAAIAKVGAEMQAEQRARESEDALAWDAVRSDYQERAIARAQQPEARGVVDEVVAPVGVDKATLRQALHAMKRCQRESGGHQWAPWIAKVEAALAQQPAAVECPHRTRCDCLAACKYGYAGDGATQHQEPTT